MNLRSIDKRLVDLLQAEFPLTRHPYADIGAVLGISEEEVISLIAQLKADGVVRQIGPVFNAGSLGYKTTLVAMRVGEKQIDKAAQIIIKHPGISHGYERDNYFNLWFTLATSVVDDTEAELSRLAEEIGAEAFFSLPAVKLFKLRAHFALEEKGHIEPPNNHSGTIHKQEARLSPADRVVINELQQDLPLVLHPFAEMSSRLGMDEDEFLSRCRSLRKRGVMRRFGAAVNHRKAGFMGNAMTCWAVPAGKIEATGQKLASLKQVSHCYERKTNPLWHYNLFAMIHGRSKESCRDIADKVSAEVGLSDSVMLFSTRELKKTRIKYLV